MATPVLQVRCPWASREVVIALIAVDDVRARSAQHRAVSGTIAHDVTSSSVNGPMSFDRGLIGGVRGSIPAHRETGSLPD